MKGKGSASVKRNTGCKSSSSSTISRPVLCACGEEVALLRSNSAKNLGRLFWRCRNWDKVYTCNYFSWADDENCEQSGRLVDFTASHKEIEDLKKKVLKLQIKLSVERMKVKATGCFVILIMVMTIVVCCWLG
ncbi:Zinc finger, GRF-type [Sesbania bispinosa]|nr:Zinc finger, GRF-type [Sesbania bispinosa]